MTTIQDRMRIPWRGGAKKMTQDTIVPLIMVPSLLFFSAADPICAVLSVILLFFTYSYISNCFYANNPRTKFYTTWGVTSFVTIALIFEIKVIGMLEILPEENIWLALLFLVFVGLTYVTRSRAVKMKMVDIEENGDINEESYCKSCRKKMAERTYHCHICQTCIPERDFHFFWYDCCIGQTNNGFFMLSLLFAIITLLYSSNLTLTSVCHPFTFIGTMMLPDDCSEVYEQFDMALCFVSALYSIVMAMYLLWVLLRHSLLVSLGITGQEWEQYSWRQKVFSCGTKRVYTEGCFKNWCTLLFYKARSKCIET